MLLKSHRVYRCFQNGKHRVPFYYSSCDSVRAPRGILPRFKYLPARFFLSLEVSRSEGIITSSISSFRSLSFPFPPLFLLLLFLLPFAAITRDRWYVNYANCSRTHARQANSSTIKCNWRERGSIIESGTGKQIRRTNDSRDNESTMRGIDWTRDRNKKRKKETPGASFFEDNVHEHSY